jgi:hypothetical protein
MEQQPKRKKGTRRLLFPVEQNVYNKFHMAAYTKNKIAFRILKKMPLQVKNVSSLANLDLQFFKESDEWQLEGDTQFCDYNFIVDEHTRKRHDTVFFLVNSKSKKIGGFAFIKTFIDKPYSIDNEDEDSIAFEIGYLCGHDFLKSVGTYLINTAKHFCRQINTYNPIKTEFVLTPLLSAVSFYERLGMRHKDVEFLHWSVDWNETVKSLQTKDLAVKLNQGNMDRILSDNFDLYDPNAYDDAKIKISSNATNSSFEDSQKISSQSLTPSERRTLRNKPELLAAIKTPNEDLTHIRTMMSKRHKLQRNVQTVKKRNETLTSLLITYIDYGMGKSLLEDYWYKSFSDEDLEGFGITMRDIVDFYYKYSFKKFVSLRVQYLQQPDDKKTEFLRSKKFNEKVFFAYKNRYNELKKCPKDLIGARAQPSKTLKQNKIIDLT